MMRVCLGWRGAPSSALQAGVRLAAALPVDGVPGLKARQWLADRGGLHGAYLFEDEHAAAAFLAHPAAERAYAALAAAAAGLAPAAPAVGRVAAQETQRPIFVIAAPRSGSTLLFDLLAHAPGLWTQGGEGQGAVDGVAALHLAARGYASDRLIPDDLTPQVVACLHAGWRFGLRDRHGQAYAEPPDGAPAGHPRLLDKTTEHSLRVGFLAQACPDARFVLLHRDARQNISSLMQAWRHGGFVRLPGLAGWARGDWCFLLPPDWRGLAEHSLQSIATAQWQAACQWALHDLAMLADSRWIALDYNELVAQPRAVMHRLCAFLDLDMDPHLRAHLACPLALSATTISPPSVLKWRSQREFDVAQLDAATRITSARLRSLGVAPTAAAPPPATQPPGRVRFFCQLPAPASASPAPQPDESVVDPSLRFQLGNSIPLGLATATRFRERFVVDQPILWIRQQLTQAYQPFWVERHQAHHFAQFQAGALAPPCANAQRAQLHAAGIIASDAERAAAVQKAAAVRARAASEFAERGYCVVPAVLSAAHTAALARYYRELVAAGGWTLGDGQVAQRHGWHNESVARFFHHQLAAFVSAVAAVPVYPSYTYVSAYQQGAELHPHIDRKQCEYTLSVIIDEVGGRAVDWPLCLLAGDGPRAVTPGLGDGVLFRGHDLPHWREPAPQQGLALSTLLLHYVPADFAETMS